MAEIIFNLDSVILTRYSDFSAAVSAYCEHILKHIEALS